MARGVVFDDMNPPRGVHGEGMMSLTGPAGESMSSSWKGVCRTGGVAAWLLMAYSLATMVQLLVLGGQPATAAEAFSLIQQNRVVALLRLDVPTILALPLYYLVFLGLFAALHRDDLADALLSTALAFVGVTLLLATPMGLSMVPLSDRYAAAASDGARSQLLAAGEAIMAADMWHSAGAFVGSILLQAGAVLVSVAMLRTRVFGRMTAWLGLVTHGLDLLHAVTIPFVPTVGFLLMAVAGPLYLAWFPLIGRRLIALSR